MSTEAKAPVSLPPLGLRELSELLVQHYGLTEGQFDLLLNYQVGVGMFGPNPDQSGPGLAVSLQNISLIPTRTPNHLTIDASKIRKRRRKAASE